jgi:hypothetical protein
MKLSDITTWDIPEEIHNIVSELLSERETLKKKLEVALQMEQSVRCELNIARAQLSEKTTALASLAKDLGEVIQLLERYKSL